MAKLNVLWAAFMAMGILGNTTMLHAKDDEQEQQAQGMYHDAAAAWTQHQSSNDGVIDLYRIILNYPNTDAAQRSLVLLRHILQETADDATALSHFIALAELLGMRTDSSSMRAQLWVLAGDCAAHHGDVVAAERWLRCAVAVADGTMWWDDALLTYARVLRRLSRPLEAIAQYQRIQEAHTKSWFVGSYQSLFYDDALLEIGDAWREYGDVPQARNAYKYMIKKQPHSRLVDDAATRLAALPLR